MIVVWPLLRLLPLRGGAVSAETVGSGWLLMRPASGGFHFSRLSRRVRTAMVISPVPATVGRTQWARRW